MAGEKQYFVYMLASSKHGTLYIGVTRDLLRRVWEHKEGVIEGFTQKYRVHKLVWFEEHQEINEAILREKRLKEWRRDWKINLIEASKPEWVDLYYGLTQ